MKPHIKKKWQEALRSGEYTQGRFNLTKNGCFCATGVLVDLYTKETGVTWSSGTYPFDSRCSVPPEVLTWASLGTRPAWYIINKNDQEHYTLDQIADELDSTEFKKLE